jgi:hypothetical protein
VILGGLGESYNLLLSELLLLLLLLHHHPKSSCLIDTTFDASGFDCRKLVLFLGLRGEVIIVIHRQAGRQAGSNGESQLS